MTTVQAFNAMLRSFLSELVVVFPEDDGLCKYRDQFEDLVKINIRKPLELFMGAVTPHLDKVFARDPLVFDLVTLSDLEFKKMWNAEGVSDATRDAMWKYMNSLCLLGVTINSLPAEFLTSIESMAQNCADQMTSSGTPPSLPNLTDMMSTMTNLFGSGGGGGNNPLMSLLNHSAPSLEDIE